MTQHHVLGKCDQDMSKNLDGAVKIVKVDTDKYPKLASKYHIQVHAS